MCSVLVLLYFLALLCDANSSAFMSESLAGGVCQDVSTDTGPEALHFIQKKQPKYRSDKTFVLQNASSNISMASFDAGSSKKFDLLIVNSAKTAERADPVLDDVVAAFTAFATNGVPIDVSKGSKFPTNGYNNYLPPYSSHFEGVVRLRASSGNAYLILTGATDSAGHIFVAELNTPSATGALASKGSKLKGQVIGTIIADSKYTHAGGPAVYGNYLAVGVEAGCQALSRLIPGACKSASHVNFFDISDPRKVVQLPYFVDRPSSTAGAVGLTLQDNGKFLLVVGQTDSKILDFYVSNSTDGDLSKDPDWHLVGSWSKEKLASGKWRPYQALNLVVQRDGEIFLIGSTRDPLLIGRDYFDLFRVSPSGDSIRISQIASKAMTCTGCDFAAAASVYVDSAKNLRGYAAGWLPGNPIMPDAGIIHINEFS